MNSDNLTMAAIATNFLVTLSFFATSLFIYLFLSITYPYKWRDLKSGKEIMPT
jgi:hypothetical protein